MYVLGGGKGEVVDVAVCESIGANIWELPGVGWLQDEAEI